MHTLHETKQTTNSFTDAISQEVIDKLPPIIRQGANFYRTPYEKTIFIYSALSACGGLLTEGSGKYFQRQVYPNLFFLLLAPAASGKSSLTSAYDLLYPIHTEYLNKSLEAQEQYKRAIQDKGSNKEQLRRPKFNSVLIPGNISSSRLIQHIADNEPNIPSIVVESELDTISQANKSDFGGFSDALRKAFQNERISLSRKGNDEFIEVRTPKLSMILSGTPKQLFRLMPSAEDGLYSRFMMYSYNPEIKWVDVSPDSEMTDASSVMEKLASEYYSFWKFFKGRSVEFQLNTKQWERINSFFEGKLMEMASLDGTSSISVVKRHGLICFKLCMILTALRAFEFGAKESVYECYDRDFEAALTLSELSLQSSLNVLEHLPDGEHLTSRKQKKENFKCCLPDSFTTNEALELSKTANVGTRSVHRWIEEWVIAGLLTREAHGQYKKV